MVTVWSIALATSSAARMEQAPVPSAQTPLAGSEASVSFVVLTVNGVLRRGEGPWRLGRGMARSACDGFGHDRRP